MTKRRFDVTVRFFTAVPIQIKNLAKLFVHVFRIIRFLLQKTDSSY